MSAETDLSLELLTLLSTSPHRITALAHDLGLAQAHDVFALVDDLVVRGFMIHHGSAGTAYVRDRTADCMGRHHYVWVDPLGWEAAEHAAEVYWQKTRGPT